MTAQLKVRTKLTHFVDYADFDAFVNDVYGVTDFSIVRDQSMQNFESITYEVKKAHPLACFEQQYIDEFLDNNGNKPGMFFVLLQDLVNRGFIPTGTYSVEVGS